MRRATAGGHPQFASMLIRMSGPASARTARTRSRSSSGSNPTLTLRHCTPHCRNFSARATEVGTSKAPTTIFMGISWRTFPPSNW